MRYLALEHLTNSGNFPKNLLRMEKRTSVAVAVMVLLVLGPRAYRTNFGSRRVRGVGRSLCFSVLTLSDKPVAFFGHKARERTGVATF